MSMIWVYFGAYILAGVAVNLMATRELGPIRRILLFLTVSLLILALVLMGVGAGILWLGDKAFGPECGMAPPKPWEPPSRWQIVVATVILAVASVIRMAKTLSREG